jgi:hypothetical protein
MVIGFASIPTVILTLPFSSERYFVVYSYGCGHGLLLLRSRKTNSIRTRLDILFTDVRALELRFWFDGIKIEEADASLLKDLRSNPCGMIEHGNRIYSLKGDGWSGFIVGGAVHFHEDDKMQNEPSALIHG